MTTVLDIIRDAAETSRVIAPGESFPNDEAQSVFRELNRMLGSWANENLLTYAETEETFTLTVNKPNYTIGPTGNFPTTRPQEVLEGSFVRDAGGNNDYPLIVKTLQEYHTIWDKSTGSIPWWITYNPTYPNGTLYLWWAPETAYELHLLSLKELGSFANLTTTISLPPGYEDAIMYNLSLRIGAKYGKTIREDIVALAQKGVTVLKRRNSRRLPPAELEVGSFTRRSVYNINTGLFFPR